jgi:hypothetical protein
MINNASQYFNFVKRSWLKAILTPFILAPILSCATSGNKKPDLIDDAIRSKRDEYVRCYEKELNRTGQSISGKIVAAFYVETDGTVTDEKIQSTTMNSPRVESCILGLIKTTRFKTHGEPHFLVRYPFEFASRH